MVTFSSDFDTANVPDTPGVPPLMQPRAPQTPQATLVGDTTSVPNLALLPWGIFTTAGVAIVVPDSIVDFAYQKEFRVPTYPIEQGGFISYNKVELPFDSRVTMAKGGANSDRESFLNLMDTLVASTDLYTITTPEKSYMNANIVAFDYERRADKGAKLLLVGLHLEEIRSTTAPAFSSTKSPAGAVSVNQGPLQSQAPTPGQTPPPPRPTAARLNAIEDGEKVGPQ